MFEIARRGFSSMAALSRTKLGRCPRCQMLAGWGSVGGWSLCLLTRAANLPVGWTTVTAAIATAFSLLLFAHTVAFARWMAHAMRKAQPSGLPFEPWTPREFTILIARLTFVNFRTSMFGGR